MGISSRLWVLGSICRVRAVGQWCCSRWVPTPVASATPRAPASAQQRPSLGGARDRTGSQRSHPHVELGRRQERKLDPRSTARPGARCSRTDRVRNDVNAVRVLLLKRASRWRPPVRVASPNCYWEPALGARLAVALLIVGIWPGDRREDHRDRNGRRNPPRRDGDPSADRPRGRRADGPLELVAAPLAGAAVARPALAAAASRARRSGRVTFGGGEDGGHRAASRHLDHGLGGGLTTECPWCFRAWVVRALAALRPPHDIAAMQSIDASAVTLLFMSAA